jgi:hypothetical protein
MPSFQLDLDGDLEAGRDGKGTGRGNGIGRERELGRWGKNREFPRLGWFGSTSRGGFHGALV